MISLLCVASLPVPIAASSEASEQKDWMLESEPRERNEPVEARRKGAGCMGVKLVVVLSDVDIVAHHHDPHAGRTK